VSEVEDFIDCDENRLRSVWEKTWLGLGYSPEQAKQFALNQYPMEK